MASLPQYDGLKLHGFLSTSWVSSGSCHAINVFASFLAKWYPWGVDQDVSSRGPQPNERSSMDRGSVVSALSVAWFLMGSVVFFAFGILAFAVNPFATDSMFEPEGYRGAVMLWHLPMVWGWVPVAIRSARRRPRPWEHAGKTILFGVCLGPLLFLGAMLVWRVILSASAGV